MEDKTKQMENISLGLAGIWEFKQYPLSARKMQDLDDGNWHQTTRPASIFSALLQAGKITEDDLGKNPEKLLWVSQCPWIFKKTFDVPQEIVESQKTELVFEGLDTIASIWLNEKLIGKTDNMFIAFCFDVTEYIKPNGNVLLIKFDSPQESAAQLKNRCGFSRRSIVGQSLSAYIRKAKFQFGSDFCPPLTGCGICRPVKIQSTKKARIADVHIRTIECNPDYADVKIKVQLGTKHNEEITCKLTISDNALILDHEIVFRPGEISHSALIRIEKPQLWWPLGHGGQNLYQLDVRLITGEMLIDCAEKIFGIRTIKLDCSPDEIGSRFRFVINSRPIYITGANWLPASMFPGSVKSKDYERLLTAAAEANINMLRIWAGGTYESDEFYKLCDQLGILLWQDFMFSADRYPSVSWFIEQVKKEAVAVIRRLRSHPCLALWCGNDEIDRLYSEDHFGKGAKDQSRRIFHKILPQLVAELDPDTYYIPSTPGGGKTDLNGPDSGTVNQNDFWRQHKPLRDLLLPEKKIPRFVSAFGLASLPDCRTIESFCPPEDKHIGSRIIESHNYQLDSDSRIYRYVADNFGTARDIDELIYLSQITQARAAKTFTEHLRAYRSRNDGLLLWHFNDPYPATTCSAIDYTQTPKAIYYYTKRFYQPLMIAILPDYEPANAPSQLSLRLAQCVVVNDSLSPVTATLKFKLLELTGTVLDEAAMPISVMPNSASRPVKFPGDLLNPQNPSQICLWITLEKENRVIAENLFFYLPDKYIDWPDVRIKSLIAPISETQFKLTLSADAIARDVQISVAQASHLSDNFIDLIGEKQTELIVTYPRHQLDAQPQVTLRSINSIFVQKCSTTHQGPSIITED